MNPSFTANWHTHTARCKHASGQVADYCRAAVAAGLRTLGFSDHTPFPGDNRWFGVRMAMAELDGYRRDIEAAREAFPSLLLPIGLECEYLPELDAFYHDDLLGRQGMEYLVGAVHWFPYRGAWPSAHSRETANDPAALAAFADHSIACLRSGLFRFLAHPDGFGMFYDTWDDETLAISRAIAQAAHDCKVPLEINAYGLRKPHMTTPQGVRPVYPWEPFWEVAAACDAPVVVNADAHRPEDVVAAVDAALALARRCGVRLVTL